MALKILGRITSINVRKVRWTADLLGLPYETEVWGLPDRDPNVPEFLALNPNAQVPVLIEDDLVLWESNAIMRHLAERLPNTLWPEDRRRRALVDQWLTWQASELNPAWVYPVQSRLRRNPSYQDPERVAEGVRRWTRLLAMLDRQLERGGGHVVGAGDTLADIALALSTHRWLSTPIERQVFPAVEAHHRRLGATAPGRLYMGEGIV